MNDRVADNKGALAKAIHSGKWMLYGTATQKILSVATFFILARILTPEHYGIIAVVLMITSTTNLMTSHGLEMAIAQRGVDVEKYLDSIWTLNILRALALAILIFILSKPLSIFFHIPTAVNILRVGGLLLIAIHLINVRQIHFVINLDFKKLFWRDFAGQIAYTISALSWALFVQASAWALLVGHMARQIVSDVVTYIEYPCWPRLSFKFRPLLNFIGYSKWISGQVVLDYITNFIDPIFVGRMLGPSNLGLYSKANELASTATATLLSIMRKISFYAYNTVQSDLQKIQKGFIKSLDVIGLIMFPFSFLIFIEGEAIVSMLLGQRWLLLVVPLKILAIANFLDSISGIFNPVFNILGKPKINAYATLLRLISSLALLYFAAKWWGMTGVAVAILIMAFLVLLYNIWESMALLKLGWRKVMPSILQPVVSLVPLFVLFLFLQESIHKIENAYLTVVWLILLLAIYAISFLLLSRFFKQGPRNTIIDILAEFKHKGDLIS
ncbi:MAG: oligosaccharide flippase family protein [bacterium]|nr:oligosaccharide flippase family protein [bacterium]